VRPLFPSLWAFARVSELALGPLSKRACEEIAKETLGRDAEGTLVERLVAHCEGNPFFMEEMLRSAAEGRLDALPDTVVATVQSRLSSLDADARRLLRAAAVLGPTFWEGGVRALLGATGDDEGFVDTWMRHLHEREWIAMRPTSSVDDEVEWCFTQSSVREAAYASLTDADRRRGHRLAAEWLVAHGVSDAMTLAEHFERGGQPERAVPRFVQAARHSLEGDDLEAALSRAVRGLACAQMGGGDVLRSERGMLNLVRAEAHRYRGENAEAAGAATVALELLEARSTAWYFALAESATAHGRIDAHDRLLELARLFDDPPSSADGIDAFCTAACRLTISLSHRGHFAAAEAILDAAERVAATQEARGPHGEAAIAIGRLTLAHTEIRPGAALAWALRAVTELDRAGDRRNACMQRVNVGWSYVVLGMYGRARAWLSTALDAAIALGLEDAAAMARQNLGLALALDGEPASAIALLNVARAAFGRQQNRLMDVGTRIYLALAMEALGDLAQAEIECRGAALLLADVPAMRCIALARLASILRARGETEQANDAALEAMDALRRAGRVPEGEAHVRLEHVVALASTGAIDRARTELAALSAQIVACAGEIDDTELRESFLCNVSEHARILQMAASLGSDTPRP
jgi:tetratricopeptide (TPR) repeat protein